MKFNYVEHYTKDAELFDYFEERTGATEHDERRVHEYIISKAGNDAANIMDIGCGSGWAAGYFTRLNKYVLSIDISIKNAGRVLETFRNKHHSAVAADSFHLPIKNNSMDLVIASEIIEHVVDPEKFLEEAFSKVKPGGKLIITTPYKEKIKYTLCIHCNQKTPVNAHLHSFDEFRLSELYHGADIEGLHIEKFGNKILIFLRTYVILKYLPFPIWKLFDRLFNLIYDLPAHVILIMKKKADAY